jgi:hypothetical protein
MSNVKFLSLNLCTQPTTVITASTAESFYPASNLKDPRTTKKFRSTASSANIVFDFITAEIINTIAIKADSLGAGFGFTGDLTLELNATDSWGSPAFTIDITPSELHNIGYETFANQEYRFARLVATGSSYVELSNIFIGQYTQLANNNIDFGWSYVNTDLSRITKNTYGQKFIDQKNFQKEISASFKLLNVTEFTTISDLYDLHGKTEPIWFIVDEGETIVDARERFINQFYFNGDLVFKNSAYGLYDTSFALEEVI